MNKRKESNLKFLLTVLGESIAIGLAVMGSILAGAITGWFIEEKLLQGRTSPWITTIFIIFGAIGGIKNLLYYTRKRFKEKGNGKS
ncbi:MAG: AtpZ/AtpI family protein [Caldimicrobium sp.]|nr:AtpZ/AtpI family protein [Caldimicrobium sp.]